MIFFIIFITFDMTIGYSIVTYFGVSYDSIPMRKKTFLLAVSIPVLFNILLNLLLYIFHQRLITIIIMADVSKISVCNEHEYLRTLMKLIDKINDCVLSVNKCFILNTMFSSFNVTVTMILMTFLSMDIVLHELEIEDVILALGGFSYCGCLGGSCIAVVYFSSTIRKCHEHLKQKLINLHVCLVSPKIHRQIHLGLLQLLHSQKAVTCGLFRFNWKYVFSMITSVFNYVIVMYQFDSMISFVDRSR